jgi:hypothetical protein
MKKTFLLLFSLATLAAAVSCQSSKPKTEEAPPATADASLTSSMQGLKAEMDRLLPLLVNPKQFNAVENQKRIKEEIETLEHVSTNVTHSKTMQAEDPTLNFLSRGFHDEIKRAREAFEIGHREYARGTLLNVTAYCIECHTRTASGPSFQTDEVQKTLKSLRPLDRGEYLLAIRQYDAALNEFDQVIRAGVGTRNNVFDVDRATRLALSITVRFRNDPNASLKIVNDVLESKTVPYYLKSTAKTWKQSLNEWKKESKRAARRDVLKTCQTLVHRARAKQQGPDDRAGDIEMMRVQGLLHPVLASEKNPTRLGQALYLLGVAYEAVKDLAMWSLHEDYYETCIRKVPHSEWSAQCYRKLEESVLLGYTGSAGTSIPEDVEKRLNELQKLAL